MSNQNINSKLKSTGFPSEFQIEQWSNQGKRKAKIFYQKQLRLNKDKKINKLSINQSDVNIVFNSSLNRLRQKTKTQRSNSSILSNRIMYLDTQINRKKQIVDVAKYKYKKMIQVRSQKIKDDIQLSRIKNQFQLNHHRSVTLKASNVKVNRKNSSISAFQWRQKNKKQAQEIKNAKMNNQKLINERLQQQKLRNKIMVEKSHRFYEESRKKMKLLQKSKIEAGVQLHNLKLLDQFAKGQIQRRKNHKFFNVVKQKVKQISNKRQSLQKELRHYAIQLGLVLPLKKQYKKQITQRKQSPQSFYMTNR